MTAFLRRFSRRLPLRLGLGRAVAVPAPRRVRAAEATTDLPRIRRALTLHDAGHLTSSRSFPRRRVLRRRTPTRRIVAVSGAAAPGPATGAGRAGAAAGAAARSMLSQPCWPSAATLAIAST